MKKCRYCFKEKPLSLFYRHSRTKDKLMNKCIACHKACGNRYYDEVRGPKHRKTRRGPYKKRKK